MAEKRARRLPKVLAEGARDVPRNTLWLFGKALSPATGAKNAAASVGAAAGDRISGTVRGGASAMKDAMPFTGSSVEHQLQRARAAAHDAGEAEQRALESAETAQRLTAEAKETEQSLKAYLRDLRREQTQHVAHRVADARRIAEAEVREEEQRAQAEAERVLEDEDSKARARVDAVKTNAEEARDRAQRDLAEARERLAEARRLAEEATAAASAAAEEAHRQADELTATAQAQAADLTTAAHADADSQRTVAAIKRTAAAHAPRRRNRPQTARKTQRISKSSLQEMNKEKLLELASTREISGRSSMSKSELVSALSSTR